MAVVYILSFISLEAVVLGKQSVTRTLNIVDDDNNNNANDDT